MSIKLEAPYPAIQTIIYLPNPLFNDSEAITDSIQVLRSMTGIVRTYVKTTNNRRSITFNFKLSRLKGLELREFIRSYYRSSIRLTDHLGQVWNVKLSSNPFDFSTPGPVEQQTIQVSFEGTKL